MLYTVAMKRKLPTVTLLGIDCVNIERLVLASEICQKDFEFAEVKLLTSLPAPLGVDVVKIDPLTSTEEYSEFVITHLHEYVDTPHVLVIQYDGFILNPDAWNDAFLEYDYIGAPWWVQGPAVKNDGFPVEALHTWLVGNGGFSLRSKKLLELCADLAKSNAFTAYHPEDVVLSVHNRDVLEERGVQFAPVALAKEFSYEAVDEKTDYEWNGQFGFHGIRWTDISAWTKQYPEYVVDMKGNTITRRSE